MLTGYLSYAYSKLDFTQVTYDNAKKFAAKLKC